MGYVSCMGNCCACHRLMVFNPISVPSLVINGVREPLCESCFNRWNYLHRTSKGLEPIPLEKDAYIGCPESELP